MKTRMLLIGLAAGVSALLAGCDEGTVVYEETVYTYEPAPAQTEYVVYEQPTEYVLDVLVTDAWGYPMQGAWVEVAVADAQGYSAGFMTDAYGYASFSVLSYPGTVVSLVVSSPGYMNAYEVVYTDEVLIGYTASVTLTTTL